MQVYWPKNMKKKYFQIYLVPEKKLKKHRLSLVLKTGSYDSSNVIISEFFWYI